MWLADSPTWMSRTSHSRPVPPSASSHQEAGAVSTNGLDSFQSSGSSSSAPSALARFLIQALTAARSPGLARPKAWIAFLRSATLRIG